MLGRLWPCLCFPSFVCVWCSVVGSVQEMLACKEEEEEDFIIILIGHQSINNVSFYSKMGSLVGKSPFGRRWPWKIKTKINHFLLLHAGPPAAVVRVSLLFGVVV